MLLHLMLKCVRQKPHDQDSDAAAVCASAAGVELASHSLVCDSDHLKGHHAWECLGHLQICFRFGTHLPLDLGTT